MNLFQPKSVFQQPKIETAIREAIFGIKTDIDFQFHVKAETRGFKPSDFSKYPKDSSKKLLYKKIEPIRPEVEHQLSEKKEQQQLIESDDNIRERELITTSFPQSAVGVVLIKESDDSSTMKWGSGVMIGPDLVLTAAHNVYDNQKPFRKRYPCIKFIPAANEDEAPFGEIGVQSVFAPEKYISHQGDEENYALMILTIPIGREIGYYGVKALPGKTPDKLLKGSVISVVGYHAVENLIEKSEISFEEWRERAIIQKIEEKTGLIHYDVKAGPSQGGGGVFTKNLDTHELFVIGVHIDRDIDSGWACMITKERFAELHKFISGYEGKTQKFEEIIQSKDDKEKRINKLMLSNKQLGLAELRELAEYRLRGLEEIDLSANSHIQNEGIEFLCKNTVWENLQRINLVETGIGNDGCYSLSKNETWKQLKVLYLGGNDISDNGVLAIVKSKNFLCLEEIGLDLNAIGDDGASAIGMDTSWKNLKALSLSYNKIGGKGAICISSNTTWKNLKALRLNYNQIGDDGAVAISNNLTWTNLEELRLSKNEIGDKGATALAEHKIWTNLKLLDLGVNKITAEGAEAIGKNVVWQCLEVLDLSYNKMQDSGAIAISSNTTWSNLKVLNLRSNQIGEEGGVAVGRNTTWKQLEELYIDHNQIGNKGATVIGRNLTWKSLEHLDLSACEIGYQGRVALARNPAWKYMKKLNLMDNIRPTPERIKALEVCALLNQKHIQSYLRFKFDFDL